MRPRRLRSPASPSSRARSTGGGDGFLNSCLEGSGLPDAMAFLGGACGPAAGEERICEDPVFLLSAGWRSGSTLVQRLISSDKRVVVWGEPFEDLLPVQRLAASLGPLRDGDPHLKYSFEHLHGELSAEWIANLNPGLRPLRSAHLAFFEAFLARSAKERGFARWGAKWVRLTAAHAEYLLWLYPRAKLVFLVRHPLHAYASYKGRSWFLARPFVEVRTLRAFIRHWALLAGSFASESRRLGAFFLRYEDLLADPGTIARLAEFLGAEIDPGVLSNRVGASKDKKSAAGPWERAACALKIGGLLKRLGYSSSGAVSTHPPSL